MAAKKTKKAAAAEDPAEAAVRQMPAMKRDDAVVWLCHTFGFDPMLLESAIGKGWVEWNAETGMYAGVALIEKTPEGGKYGEKDDPPLTPPASANGCPLQPPGVAEGAPVKPETPPAPVPEMSTGHADIPAVPAGHDDPSAFVLF